MLNEFYKYIANNIISYFQSHADTILPGERYSLNLDTEEMVTGVVQALFEKTKVDGIQGTYQYETVYRTFTIQLSANMEVVVAAKYKGVTENFLTTLRNAELTDQHFPILMITYSSIDTITSGTGDLSANGMPFHATSIISKIKDDIATAQLSESDQALLELELERKQKDRFSDHSSLYEYSNMLTVLGRGFVEKSDFASFGLLYDDQLNAFPKDKLKGRLQENHRVFDHIDWVVKHANIEDSLEKEYDKQFIDRLVTAKKKGLPWHEGFTFEQVKGAHDRLEKKLNNPLEIQDEWITVYSNSALEYNFAPDQLVFIRPDGETKAKLRRKNILIYNPDLRSDVTVHLKSNIAIRDSWVDCIGAQYELSSKEININLKPEGCTFARVAIVPSDENPDYLIKICVLNVRPQYLENIQTNYRLDVPKFIKRSKIQIIGLNRILTINPEYEDIITESLKQGEKYSCNYNQTLQFLTSDEEINSDSDTIDFQIKCGAVEIPLEICDEAIKPVEITGIRAFQLKYQNKRGMEYRDHRIISGTKEYFAKAAFQESLERENTLIQNKWLAAFDTITETSECQLNIPEPVYTAYINYLEEFEKLRQLPSLAYLSGSLLECAKAYVSAVLEELNKIQAGDTLSNEQNDLLRLGCIFMDHDEHTIAMSPLHPLNVAYQLALLEEKNTGDVRDQLIEKLSALYLVPYIKDKDKNLYHAIEQRHSPEWRLYAPLINKSYRGSRNFVQKLVSDKIEQYISHFTFLFDDLGNDTFCINLVNMGDCREVLLGLIQFFVKELKTNTDLDQLMHFTINIYSQTNGYNDFSVLSDQKKLREYIENYGRGIEDSGEMALILSKNIRCYYRSSKEATYQYAHLAFYEMESSEDRGTSRMDSIATGMALGGLISGTPSVLNYDWYKTGFGTKFAKKTTLSQLAKIYNAMFRVAFSGSSYEPESAIFTEISRSEEGLLGKIYDSSNWVVFVDPKVDLSFFTADQNHQDLTIIHYSDQYTSSSGYDDITVTKKSQQYEEIIREHLNRKGVHADQANIHDIIDLFNAVNGSWLLRLISTKKLAGAVDSNFSREKMSILSAIKFCMAYYAHDRIVWVPISLEEMLRVSGGAGYSQKEGLLSAKNLGFDKGATCDDLLMVGIEGPVDDIKVYLHPVEVKIGVNPASVIGKAKEQVLTTYRGFWNALSPQSDGDTLECKLTRNFFMQMVIVCCEKMKLYNIYPSENWDLVLDTFREALLNEQYHFSTAMDPFLGKGTVFSFKTEALNKKGEIQDEVCLLEFPEKMGSEFMVKSAEEIECDLDHDSEDFPLRLKFQYSQNDSTSVTGSAEERTTAMYCVTEAPLELSDSPADIKEQAFDQQEEETCVIPSPNSETTEERNGGETAPHEASAEEVEQSDSSALAEPSSPEPDHNRGMEVLFGTDLTNGEKLYWHPNNTNEIFHTNTGIIGTMGTGKTQFTKSMITQLYRDQSHNFGGDSLGILIFDYKGDYNESKEDFIQATNAKVLKPYHLPFNPLALTRSQVFKPLLPIHTANAFKDTLAKVYGLGAKQQNTLFSCIIQAYEEKGIKAGDPETWDRVPPTFSTVYGIYANDEDIKKTDSLAAAMDKLHQFQVFEGDPQKTESLFDILNGVIVIDLSGYDSDIQSLIVAITLDLFYAQMQAAGSSKMNQQYRQLTKLILVDEADNFMSEGFPALKKILKEGREFGVGTILSTQFLKHFGATDDDYAKYILTWVVHNVADLKLSDVEFVFKTEAKSLETQKLFNDIKGLQKHHSIVKIGTARPRYIADRAFWELFKDLPSN